METYNSVGGRFEIKIPSNWKARNLSKPNNAESTTWQFNAPDGSAAIWISVRLPQSQDLSADDLGAILEDDVLNETIQPIASYFEIESPAAEVEDAEVLTVDAEYYYEVERGDEGLAMIAYAYCEYYEDRIVAVLSAVDEEKAEPLSEKIDQILDTFNLDTSASG